ncbi:MAG: c-type cytochrome [Pirellulales bacterium]|nr:c-type cytochrome [Pirellulales bacterium]
MNKRNTLRRARRRTLFPFGRAIFVRTMLLTTLFSLARNGFSQEIAEYFRTRCTSCHTIGGGRLTGPDLKNVMQRAAANGKDREWLIRFMQDPQAAIQSGDAYALKLQRETPGNAVMPTQPDMTRQLAGSLLDLIEAETKLERSQFAGSPISLAPFTPEDVQLGRELFRGSQSLAGGAPPCISCHAVQGLAALGGGRLGPDLTLVNERLGGPKGVSTWLLAPPMPTMQSVFKTKPLKPEEIHALAAFLDHSALQGAPADMSGPLGFFLLGLGGAVAGLVLVDGFWSKRFRSVRYPLVHGQQQEGDE